MKNNRKKKNTNCFLVAHIVSTNYSEIHKINLHTIYIVDLARIRSIENLINLSQFVASVWM